jgi:hypothetical protein
MKQLKTILLIALVAFASVAVMQAHDTSNYGFAQVQVEQHIDGVFDAIQNDIVVTATLNYSDTYAVSFLQFPTIALDVPVEVGRHNQANINSLKTLSNIIRPVEYLYSPRNWRTNSISKFITTGNYHVDNLSKLNSLEVNLIFYTFG